MDVKQIMTGPGGLSGGASLMTFYPDADPESTSVDGWVQQFDGGGLLWADIQDGDGNEFVDDTSTLYGTYIRTPPSTNYWSYLARSIILFDTSALPDGATIISATLSLYGAAKSDGLGIAPDVNVYSSAPASETELEAGDFNSLGTTPFCDTPITYANFDADGWNEFELNATGIAAINKIGITKLGLRNANYDAANIKPDWSSLQVSYLGCVSADGDADQRPKLAITYRV